MLNEQIASRYAEQFVHVDFNPWVHRAEPNVLVPLLHVLFETLESDPRKRFVESAKKIWDVLVRVGADVVLKATTLDKVSLEQLEKYEQRYLAERSRVTSEMRRLRNTLRDEAEKIRTQGARLLITIDDLDRCEPSDIIAVLESIKLFFDVPNVIVILAVDKEVIDRGIEVKYDKFSFAKDRRPAIGAEYLEKMVQLPIHLFPIPVAQVRAFMDKLSLSDAVRGQLDLLQTMVPPSPRKIKRILNTLSVTASIAQAALGMDRVDLAIVARLAVLQVQSFDVYADIVNVPELLLGLELVHADRRRLDRIDPFGVFGDRAAIVWDLSKKHYQANSFQAALFRGMPFDKVKTELPQYLSMVGA